ncbi:MAG: protein kinase [Pirellulales bacterium]
MSDQTPHLDSLFAAAVEIGSAAERAAFLDQACGENHQLRGELERLLHADEQAKSFLERPPAELSATILPGPDNPDRAASLEAGLAASFGQDAAVVIGNAGHSVLKTLGQTLDIPRVMLREPAAEGVEPIVQPKSPEMPQRDSDSRYRLDGEIARGGMGAILKGRDTDLGRDLAIKVLLDAHKNKPEVVQRFVEEAQIGGQLQHPGIAPIYELGQFADKRPFFAMKLVKGETLSKLLADRAAPTAERGKFVGIFEQVCQTMAYAHSRGVIHRDLKPANIMVGAFGEVQVMDWGLAKVLQVGGIADEKKSQGLKQGQSIIQTLRSGVGSDLPPMFGSTGSHTQMGSVMGTPAYMPPEQALGEVDRLDERADVFGLGAILCEILTGQPPYVGTDGTMVYRQASRGKLNDAFARLDACGADAELIALTKHCLELEPQNRPGNAGVLAERVTGYLESVETKLHETELAKVDAQVRAEELRRRQKLSYSAGAAIAASLLIGMTASVWQMKRAERETVRATKAEQEAVATVDELRATAPAFAEQARGMAAKEQYADAIAKLDYAIKLRPDAAEFLVAKGDLLRCQLQLVPAAAIYREALRLQPGLARAEASAKLCEELLAAKPAADGKLSRESLAKLHVAMQQQQRPAAELLPVARLLGEEKKLLVEYWLARFKDLPVSAENPLEKRLTVREDGRLALDLSGTKVLDLTPLANAPLAALNLSQCQDLSDLSHLRGLELIDLNISETSVADLRPLREMRTLENLDISSSRVSDLTALSELRLKSLECKRCRISDLHPIRKMSLEAIDLVGTRVADISPLIGMPIKSIDLSLAPVLDFSPLAQLPLEKCYLQRNRITDLGVLRGKPLKELVIWGCEEARNYAVLSEIKTLELLLIPATYRELPAKDYEAIGALRNLPELRQLGSEIMNRMGYAATGSKDIFWQEWDREQAFFSELRLQGIKFGFRKHSVGTYTVDIREQPLRDLSILKGMPIVELDLHRCLFTDLTPLRGLKLEKLSITSDVVTDLSPLRGMSIDRLYLNNCSKLTDVSPLTELPLRELYLDGCRKITDVGALAEIPTLERVTVPILARNVEALQKLPKLKLLGFQLYGGVPDTTAANFWEIHRFASRLHESGIKPQALRRLDNGMWDVDLSDSGVADLSPLRGMPIERLNLFRTVVTDLTPISELPLTFLELSHTPIADLGPLRGMPLKNLRLYRTQVSDLSPLQGMSLEQLDLSYTKVTDISVLRGMPLIEAKFMGSPALTDISPLADCKDLQIVTLPPKAKNFDFLRGVTKLRRLGFGEDTTAAEFWQGYDSGAWPRTLYESGVVVKSVQRLPDGTWQLDISNTAISDLAFLKGAPISDLNISTTAVTDLTPLRGMALKRLSLGHVKVSDLSPLEGMQLEVLQIIGTNVKNIEVLRGMPLHTVLLLQCKELTDISPLADCKGLQNIQLPPNATNIEFLRAFPKLTRIGFRNDPITSWLADKTPAQFWKEYDSEMWLRTLRESGVAIKSVQRRPDGTWELNLSHSAIKDLAILKGAPISELSISVTAVKDLTPLHGMPLKTLSLTSVHVTDLSPLKGMRLESLQMSRTPVKDIAALRGMPLTSVRFVDCKELTDLSPLEDCQELQNIQLPPNATNIEFLRAFPKLTHIGYQQDPKSTLLADKTAAEFWREYDAKKK